jgi:hypothetical protein
MLDKVIAPQNQSAEMVNQMLLKNQDKLQISLRHGMIETTWKLTLQLIRYSLRKKLLKFLLKEDMKHYWITMKMERILKGKFRNMKNNNKIIIMYSTLKVI